MAYKHVLVPRTDRAKGREAVFGCLQEAGLDLSREREFHYIYGAGGEFFVGGDTGGPFDHSDMD